VSPAKAASARAFGTPQKYRRAKVKILMASDVITCPRIIAAHNRFQFEQDTRQTEVIAAWRQRIEETPHALKVRNEIDGQYHDRRRVAHHPMTLREMAIAEIRIRACAALVR